MKYTRQNTDILPSADPREETCRFCGAIGRPTLTKGTGPHAIRASCGSCGTFLRWVSVLSPTERLARKMAGMRKAMLGKPASAAQLSLLAALGDTQAAPANMAEASERIDALKQERGQA